MTNKINLCFTKYFTLFIIFLFVSSNNLNINAQNIVKEVSSEKKVIITGQITEAIYPDISLSFHPNLLVREGILFKGELDSLGNFRLSFTLKDAFAASFTYGKQAIPLFIEPADSIYISAKGDATFSKNVRISGNETAKNHNTFVDNYVNLIATFEDTNNRQFIQNNTPEFHKNLADSLQQIQLDLVKNFEKEHTLSTDFKGLIHSKINYTHATQLLNYPYLYRRFKKLDDFPNLPKDYYDFLKNMVIQNDKGVFIPEYLDFLDIYFSNQILDAAKHSKDYNFNLLYKQKADTIRSQLTGRPLFFMLTKSIIEGLNRGNVADITSTYDFFKANNSYPDYTQIVDMVYDQYRHLAADQPAPDFPLTDSKGETVHLKDFKGKVIYIDFWATWCGPCKKEMPHSVKLKERLKEEKDLVFLYISTDKEETNWKRYLAKNEMVGVQTIAEGSNRKAISQRYNISGIPRYVLVGKDGNIAQNNAQRPSSKHIYNDIKKLLDKK